MFFLLQTALDSSYRSSLVYDEHYTFLKHGCSDSAFSCQWKLGRLSCPKEAASGKSLS